MRKAWLVLVEVEPVRVKPAPSLTQSGQGLWALPQPGDSRPFPVMCSSEWLVGTSVLSSGDTVPLSMFLLAFAVKGNQDLGPDTELRLWLSTTSYNFTLQGCQGHVT